MCDTELKREDMAHEQDSKLLHKALKTVHSQQSAIDSLQATVKSLQNNVEKKHSVFESKTFKLSGYGKKKRTNERFHSPPFYTNPNGYHIALRVYANGNGAGKGTHVSVFAVISEGAYVKWPFVGKVTVTLLNQLQDMNHHSMVTLFNANVLVVLRVSIPSSATMH